MSKNYLVFFVFCIIAICFTEALKCYTCAVNSGEVDQRCASDPAAVESGSPITNCNKKYCTSKRVEYKDPPNKVHSVFRGCDDDPDRMNTIEEDDQFITFYKACTQPLCNGGNGKGSGDGGNFDNDPNAGGVLLVEGIGSSGICTKINIILFTLSVATTAFCYAVFKN